MSIQQGGGGDTAGGENDVPMTKSNNDITNNNNNDSNITSWLNTIQKTAEQLDVKSRIEQYWMNGTRPDGRLYYETRPIRIQKGILTKPHAYGSSLLQIMDTTASNNDTADNPTILIIAAVTLMIGQPTIVSSSSTKLSTDQTQQQQQRGGGGDIVVTVSGSNSNSSTNDDRCIVIQSFLQRVLCNDANLNLQQLIIVPNQSAYRLLLNVQIISSNSNNTSSAMMDYCLLAGIAALSDTDLPKMDWIQVHNNKVYLPDSTNVSNNNQYSKFQFTDTMPCSLSAGIWIRSKKVMTTSNDKCDDDSNKILSTPSSSSVVWIIDPSYDEELTLDGNITTIVVNAAANAAADNNDDTDGNENAILAIDGSMMTTTTTSTSVSVMNMTDLAFLMRLAIARGKEIHKIIVS